MKLDREAHFWSKIIAIVVDNSHRANCSNFSSFFKADKDICFDHTFTRPIINIGRGSPYFAAFRCNSTLQTEKIWLRCFVVFQQEWDRFPYFFSYVRMHRSIAQRIRHARGMVPKKPVCYRDLCEG